MSVPAPTIPADAPVVQLNPQIAEFHGPFDRPVRAQHKLKNVGQSRLIIKIKVSESELLRARPTSSFLEVGQEIGLCFQQLPFIYSPSETYDRRKFAIFYANAPSTAIDATVCAKEVSGNDWRNLKVSIRFVLDAAPSAGDQKVSPNNSAFSQKTTDGQQQQSGSSSSKASPTT